MIADLPRIPVIDARRGGAVGVACAAAAGMRDLLQEARRMLTPPGLGLVDAVSRRWLERSGHPYCGEIGAIAGLLGRPGAHFLNASYEWACTSGVGNDPDGGIRLIRVLDWRLHGLGRNLVVAWQRGRAGDFANLTWPGYVGVVTAAAPGRFAVAINQPPMMSWGAILPLDWAIGRARLWRSRGLPPAHLLRQAFENCAGYDDAKRLLSEAPLCLPAFFVMAGTRPGEGCVIERHPDRTAIREMPAGIANHWVALSLRGKARGRHSHARLRQMETALSGMGAAGFAPTPPIINRDTRLIAVINPGRGRLAVQGWERSQPATAELALSLDPGVEA